MGTEIPCPPPLPLLGNLKDIDIENSIKSFFALSKVHGPIYKLLLGGEYRIFINNYELLNEVCDERRFTKKIAGALNQLRNAIHDGLFTADIQEHNWGVAHRVLMPACGSLSIRAMYTEMHDITCQMVLKWARFGPKTPIHVTSDFTRLALDSIGLCAMNTRFNSFYTEGLHPFITAMNDILVECARRSSRPSFMTWLARGAQHKWDEDYSRLHDVATDVIAQRRSNPTAKKDLLNALINGRDPKTGEGLSDESIRNNMVTFLIAGHETTASLLSFIFMYLMLHPDKYHLVQQEVDTVIGKAPVSVDHLSKLPYINAVVRETLRLQPVGPALLLRPTSEGPTTLGGKYTVAPGQTVVALLQQVQRDPTIFGDDANEFRPERMTDEFFNKLPRNCYKPFGNGMRGCIGRPFALQETLLAVALLFRVFDFKLVDPDYQITVKQTLAMKPDNLYMYAQLRPGMDLESLEKSLHHAGHNPQPEEEDKPNGEQYEESRLRPLYIFHGSNTGTCEELAGKLALSAPRHGYIAQIDTLDSTMEQIPTDAPVVLVTASYNGEPPDNAAQFISWLENMKDTDLDLEGVDYTVFGCGHRDWQATFGRIPTLTDELLSKHGASRVAPKGFADAADGRIFDDFEKWEDSVLWPGIEARFGVAENLIALTGEEVCLDLKLSRDSRSSTLRYDVKEACVLSNTLLTTEDVPPKRHIELLLPEGLTYTPGDYLNVLAVNNPVQVKRALRRFALPEDTIIEITPVRKYKTSLPTGRSISATELLSAYVDLNQPVTTRNLKLIIESVPDLLLRSRLSDMFDPIPAADGINGVAATPSPTHRLSPLDLLVLCPTATTPFSTFISMLPPLRLRQYSISSSPLPNPRIAALTLAVLGQQSHLSAAAVQPQPWLTNDDHKEIQTLSNSQHLNDTKIVPSPSQAEVGPLKLLFQGGVASTYLSNLSTGDIIPMSISPAAKNFTLAPPSIPLIMIAGGSGVAPFRAFVQERAHILTTSSNSGHVPDFASALLYLGSRHAEKDALYVAELSAWEAIGAVSVRRTYSREEEMSEGCRYVQDRMWKEREEVMALWENGAKVMVCGKTGLGDGVREVLKRAWGEKGWGGKEHWDGGEFLGGDRFVVEVFT